MAVVDPLLGGREPEPHGIERLRLFFPSLPLLVYTDLTPATAGVLLELGRARASAGSSSIDSRTPQAPCVSALLSRAGAERLAAGHAGARADSAGPAGRSCGEALEVMLHAPGDGPTVTALADRAQLTRRTCERWFTKVGLPSPRMVMVLIRLLYAHRLLLDPGYTVEDVALKLGYSKTKTLQMHLRAVFGLTAGELRVSLCTEEALAHRDPSATSRQLQPAAS